MRPETKVLYPKCWPEISRRIKIERHFTCEGCGQVGSKYRNPLTVHHVDYNPQNNSPGNLLVLCAKCHLGLQQGVVPSLLQVKRGQLRMMYSNTL